MRCGIIGSEVSLLKRSGVCIADDTSSMRRKKTCTLLWKFSLQVLAVLGETIYTDAPWNKPRFPLHYGLLG